MTILDNVPRRHSHVLAIALAAPLAALTPGVVTVAFAQPAAVPEAAASPPATTAAPAPAPTAEAPAPSAAPAPVTAVPTAAPAASPSSTAEPPRDEYTGPPLLLGDGKKKLRMTGYGGLSVAYTHMLHRDGVLVGGQGALLLDHRLSLGAGGYGFSRTPSGPNAVDGTPREFFTGYGGLLIRYAMYSDFPVYASLGVLIGGGAITLAPRASDHHEDTDDHDVEVRGFFVMQPDLALHVNATRWLRFGLTGGYRVATAVDDFGYGGDSVGGVVVGGNIEFGWF